MAIRQHCRLGAQHARLPAQDVRQRLRHYLPHGVHETWAAEHP